MKLTAKNVDTIFMDCLFKNDEDTSDSVIADGITCHFSFHRQRLESHKKDISSMLSQLPKEFQSDSGGGMSFLKACDDMNGNQWTGLHSVMDQLFSLGTACDKVKCPFSRYMWPHLPGGMPYYVVV